MYISALDVENNLSSFCGILFVYLFNIVIA